MVSLSIVKVLNVRLQEVAWIDPGAAIVSPDELCRR